VLTIGLTRETCTQHNTEQQMSEWMHALPSGVADTTTLPC